jgi:hypothetical protein
LHILLPLTLGSFLYFPKLSAAYGWIEVQYYFLREFFLVPVIMQRHSLRGLSFIALSLISWCICQREKMKQILLE